MNTSHAQVAKRKAPSRQRPGVVASRLSTAELEQVRSAAAADHISVSEYVRRTILQASA